MKRVLLILCIFLNAAYPAKTQGTLILHMIVEAGNHRRINTPVSAELDGYMPADTISFLLFEKVNGELIEKQSQVEAGYISRLWWILDGITEAGKTREYFLCKGEQHKINNNINAVSTSESIILKNGNAEVLRYQKSAMYPPKDVDTVYKRSGFIHPLMSPSGNIMTRVNPPDHYHHVGIWNPWTKVRTGDHVTDFWNLYEKQGTVKYSGTNSIINGPVYGGFSVRQDHVDFQGRNPEELVINEIWDVRAWNSEQESGLKAYMVDFTAFLSVAVDSSVTLEAYRYGGGIGIRASEDWTHSNSSVLTSEGKTRIDADGTRARWVDLNGKFSNKSQSGILFLSHPANREHPEPMRVWPADANNGRGDVFFEFCPIRLKEWVLDPGIQYRLKYRMLVYDGKINDDLAERLWNDFAFPPAVQLLTK